MIRIENLTHKYSNRNEEAVNGVSLHVKKGESLVIIGSSGSGKSTLLYSINRLIQPSSGRILINGENILNCHPKKTAILRGKIGMIFQEFNLSERETVLKNVLNGRLSYRTTLNTLFGEFSKEDLEIARRNLERVGILEYQEERVANLSGGQKQRVAIARALAQTPDIILADEPVSNLDPKLMVEIMDLLKRFCEEDQITLVTSLHFLGFAKEYASRIVGMKDGKIVFDGYPLDLSEEDISFIYGEPKVENKTP